jgi:hypothetical protein
VLDVWVLADFCGILVVGVFYFLVWLVSFVLLPPAWNFRVYLRRFFVFDCLLLLKGN